MSVETRHPDYTRRRPEWDKMRHCLEGEAEVKRQGELYLPKSGAQALAEKKLAKLGMPPSRGPYEAAKAMARFPEMVDSARIGFVGIATRVPWNISGLPAALDYLQRDAGSGIPLDGWQAKLIAEGISIGRYGLLPDAPVERGDARLQWYPAESITNWKTNAQALPVMTTLMEHAEAEGTDEFSHETVERYRVIRMADGRATVMLYDERGVPGDEVRLGDWFPLTFGGVAENGPVPERPPMAGLAESLLSYYRLSASHRWAIRQTCDPTLLALGFKPGEIEGVGAGMLIEKDVKPGEADLKYVEVKGTGLSHAKEEMDAELTRAYGQTNRLAERTGVEASDSIRQRVESKTASLRSVDQNGAAALEEALNNICRMNRLPPEVVVTSATDYTDEELSATVLSALVQAVGLEQLPSRVVRDYAKKRGLLEDLDDAEIVELIAADVDGRAAREVGFGGVPDEQREDVVDITR